MPLARGRDAFRLNVLLTLGAYAAHAVFLFLAMDGRAETCAACGLTSLSSLVASVLASVALARNRELRALLRWGHAALAAWMWLLYGMAGLFFWAPPDDPASAMAGFGVVLGMFVGLFSAAPLYLASVWLALRLWPRPPPAPVEAAPAKRGTTFEIVEQK